MTGCFGWELILSMQGGQVDFPPSRLKAGSGEHVCYVLDRLAEEALKKKGFAWKKWVCLENTPSPYPQIPYILEVMVNFCCHCWTELLILLWVWDLKNHIKIYGFLVQPIEAPPTCGEFLWFCFSSPPLMLRLIPIFLHKSCPLSSPGLSIQQRNWRRSLLWKMMQNSHWAKWRKIWLYALRKYVVRYCNTPWRSLALTFLCTRRSEFLPCKSCWLS